MLLLRRVFIIKFVKVKVYSTIGSFNNKNWY